VTDLTGVGLFAPCASIVVIVNDFIVGLATATAAAAALAFSDGTSLLASIASFATTNPPSGTAGLEGISLAACASFFLPLVGPPPAFPEAEMERLPVKIVLPPGDDGEVGADDDEEDEEKALETSAEIDSRCLSLGVEGAAGNVADAGGEDRKGGDDDDGEGASDELEKGETMEVRVALRRRWALDVAAAAGGGESGEISGGGGAGFVCGVDDGVGG
jgi:hypothetical protein